MDLQPVPEALLFSPYPLVQSKISSQMGNTMHDNLFPWSKCDAVEEITDLTVKTNMRLTFKLYCTVFSPCQKVGDGLSCCGMIAQGFLRGAFRMV